jgi:tetratricopeptide (TPR) repeat protein
VPDGQFAVNCKKLRCAKLSVRFRVLRPRFHMRKIQSYLGSCGLFFLLFFACQAAQGSEILVRSSSSEALGLSPVQTYAGRVDAVVTGAKPESSLTVVLLMDGLKTAELESVNKDLLALYGAMSGRPVRLMVLRNGSTQTAGPFASRARFKGALEKMQAGEENAAPVSAEALYDALAANAVQWGSNWSRVLLIGDLPALEPGVREYATALLLRTLSSQHVQVSLFAQEGEEDAWLPVFRSTGGTIIHGNLSDYSHVFGAASTFYFQVDWHTPEPAHGFVISHSLVSDLSGQVFFEGPELAVSEGDALPSIVQYAGMLAKIDEAAKLVAQEGISEADAQRIREDLRTVLEVNPLEPGGLLTASAFNEKQKDYAAAARFRKMLVEVHPLESGTWAGLGHLLLLAAEYDQAEEALQRAVDLDVLTPAIAEDLARVHLARQDDKGAIPFLEDALRGDPKRQDLWFLKAQAGEQAEDSPLAIQAYEQGLALGGVHIPETGSLVKLYLGARKNEKAAELEKAVTSSLPADAGIRAEFAEILDDLQQSTAALAAWRRVLEVQPAAERAHYQIGRLLLESGDARAAENAANEGLAVAPKYASLYGVRADALEKQGRMYEAREALEQGAAAVKDPALMLRLATVEDSYGGAAAEAYARLVDVLGGSSPQRLPLLERGFAVALRDADFKHAESFAVMLESAGHPEYRSLLSVEEKKEDGAIVLGGLDALAFAAHAQEGVPPERFFVEYSRTLIARICEKPGCSAKGYEEIHEHFQRVAALEALGKRDGNSVVVTLSLNTKQGRRDTEKVLSLLGIKLHTSKGQLELDRGEKKNQAKQQETASALAIDELAIQEALQGGKSYKLKISDERATIYPGENVWRESFYASENEPGGFAAALLRQPKMTRLYLGISSLDRKAVSALLSVASLKTLADRYADLIYSYAPAFALQGSHAAVPGGAGAESLWANLAGADPAEPGPFFLALMQRSEGRLLAFYFSLSQLDRPHQAFFTANLSRTAQFYKLFSERDEMRRTASAMVGNTAFSELLRSIPLDGEGHVDFPGSPEVWMVAKGRSSNESQTTKMMKKVSKVAAPEVEDEILLRLVQTRYHDKFAGHTELENFLSVARIDAHRPKPLDDQSALILAQEYSDFSGVYAYFTDITGLGSSDYSRFFAAIERAKSHSMLDANVELGQLHSLVEWICLLRRRRAIGDEEAANLFRFVAGQFAAADGPVAYSLASLESARSILGFCKLPDLSLTADERIRICLLGPDAQSGPHRSLEFQRVLELQKVPSLAAMLSIQEGAKNLAATGATALATIEKYASGLPLVEWPKNTKVGGKEKESILRYDPAPIHKIVAELAQKTEKHKQNVKELEKLSQELLAALQPQISLALAGQVYAYFLRPSDLVISEDPLLLRKHHYLNFSSQQSGKELVPESTFEQASEGIGSNFMGGFAQFGLSSGTAAGTGWKTAGPAGEEAIAAQIAAIRGTAWDQLEESDLRLVGLRTTAAREWIAESASHPGEFQALGEETMGLLSLTRRSDLLNGIENRNWTRVWDAVTLPDLFALGGKYLERFKTDPWPSPSTAALRQVSSTNDGARLNVLGAVTYHAFGCSHPHLIPDAPYEEYERHMFPAEIAERAAQFKLFLVVLADGLGVEPLALVNVAEPLAAKAFHHAKMTDSRDWRSLLGAFASIAPSDLSEALQQ